jgi:guanosine-3',5'-bis(diphosphate) 3'-pyrophosphohydrolase
MWIVYHPMSDHARLLQALHFSADKHRDQRRKDQGASPYINHPIEVATVLATIGGVSDLVTLMGAVLHDTIEDTDTTPEELERRFGHDVRVLVEEMTDDKRLPKEERKRLQVEHARAASHRCRLIKLGDKICNVRDVTHAPPAGWSMRRRREYLDWTEQVVAGCRGANAALEAHYDRLLAEGRAALQDT